MLNVSLCIRPRGASCHAMPLLGHLAMEVLPDLFIVMACFSLCHNSANHHGILWVRVTIHWPTTFHPVVSAFIHYSVIIERYKVVILNVSLLYIYQPALFCIKKVSFFLHSPLSLSLFKYHYETWIFSKCYSMHCSLLLSLLFWMHVTFLLLHMVSWHELGHNGGKHKNSVLLKSKRCAHIRGRNSLLQRMWVPQIWGSSDEHPKLGSWQHPAVTRVGYPHDHCQGPHWSSIFMHEEVFRYKRISAKYYKKKVVILGSLFFRMVFAWSSDKNLLTDIPPEGRFSRRVCFWFHKVWVHHAASLTSLTPENFSKTSHFCTPHMLTGNVS